MTIRQPWPWHICQSPQVILRRLKCEDANKKITVEGIFAQGFLLWLNHYREFGRNEMKWWKYCLYFGPFFWKELQDILDLKMVHSFSNVRLHKVQHDTHIEIGLFPPRKKHQRNEIVQDLREIIYFYSRMVIVMACHTKSSHAILITYNL